MINTIILVLLAISTLIQVADWIGFLPNKLRNYLKLNKSSDTLDVLEKLGIDVKMYQRKNLLSRIPCEYVDDIEKYTLNHLMKYKLDMKVSVGRHVKTKLDYYIDLIGNSCNPVCAEAYARLLCTHYKKSIENLNIKNPHFDFVVTPKNGSPILGYEFAKILNKPFVLHEESKRFDCEKDDMRMHFNCSQKPPVGSKALIVDDSTTGGRMVLNAINDLKKYGYEVSDCLVVFEPKSKDAKQKLMDAGVQLTSIVQTHI